MKVSLWLNAVGERSSRLYPQYCAKRMDVKMMMMMIEQATVYNFSHIIVFIFISRNQSDFYSIKAPSTHFYFWILLFTRFRQFCASQCRSRECLGGRWSWCHLSQDWESAATERTRQPGLGGSDKCNSTRQWSSDNECLHMPRWQHGRFCMAHPHLIYNIINHVDNIDYQLWWQFYQKIPCLHPVSQIKD